MTDTARSPAVVHGVSRMEVRRVSHGVGGSYTRWQGTPPAHSVYMIELGDQYAPAEYSTFKVYHRHGEIVDIESGEHGPEGPDGIAFKSDMSLFHMHIMDYLAVCEWVEEDIQ